MDSKPTWTNTQQAISFTLVLSFVLVIFVWMIFPPRNVDPTALTVVNMLLGALVAKFTTIVDFYFGSSQGSKDKDDAQNKMIGTLTGTGTGSPTALAAASVAAANIAAPAAAAAAAPPAAAIAAPPAAEAAVKKELENLNPPKQN